MALNPPPIQQPITDKLTNSIWVRWFDSIRSNIASLLTAISDIVSDITTVKNSFGWYDYNDLATQTTPQAILANTKTFLTNDAQGSFTRTDYKIPNIDNLYDASTNSFDFSDLSVGDVVGIRVSIIAETTSPNQTVHMGMDFAIGSASEFSITFGSEQIYKTATDHTITSYNHFYIGDDNVRQNPAKISITSDDDVNVTMNGFFLDVQRYIV